MIAKSSLAASGSLFVVEDVDGNPVGFFDAKEFEYAKAMPDGGTQLRTFKGTSFFDARSVKDILEVLTGTAVTPTLPPLPNSGLIPTNGGVTIAPTPRFGTPPKV
jgi:hypothetical protein